MDEKYLSYYQTEFGKQIVSKYSLIFCIIIFFISIVVYIIMQPEIEWAYRDYRSWG